MTHCGGCGLVLGWKKYKFHKMWRISGYYCKKCMIELGKDFDAYGKIVRPSKPCSLCGVQYYFLKQGKGHEAHCRVCAEAISSGAIPAAGSPPTKPKNLPLVMMIFAGLGALMMVMGLVYTLMATGDDASVLNILFGAMTTALGFVLLRKTLRSRSLLVGRNAAGAR